MAGVALTLDSTLSLRCRAPERRVYVLSFSLLAGVTVDEPERGREHGQRPQGRGGRRLGYGSCTTGCWWLMASNFGYALDLGGAERRHPRVRRGDARVARMGVGGGRS